jgi:soluble lytic murein transglycosylase-like protein
MGVLMAGVALSACTSTSQTTSADSAAMATVAYPQLPETIVTVPAAYAPDQTAGGSIAEATATYATAADTPQEASPQQEQSPQQAMVAATGASEAPATEAASAPAAAAAPGEAAPMVASAAPDATVMPASFAGATPSAGGGLATMPFDTGVSAQKAAMPIHAPEGRVGPAEVGARSAELDALMAKYAQHYEIPEELVRRVAKRESTFNPKARNGPYWGLMQIRHDTAKGMGYLGSASGLLDAETNLKYAVRYLRGAWLVAKGNMSVADKLYQRGYYYDAKRAGLLDETGLGKDRRRRNPS